MTATDEIRSALRESTRLPGEVRPRPAAAAVIRQRAVRRRQHTLMVSAGALTAVVALIAVTVGTNGIGQHSGEQFVVPAASSTPSLSPTPSTSPTGDPTSVFSVPAGPRTFAEPITVHHVIAIYPEYDCPVEKPLYSVDGADCYELAPAELSIYRVRDLRPGLMTNAQGQVAEDSPPILNLTLTEADIEAYEAFTTKVARSERAQMAYVVKGNVVFAPFTEPIRTGTFQIVGTDLAQLVATLGG